MTRAYKYIELTLGVVEGDRVGFCEGDTDGSAVVGSVVVGFEVTGAPEGALEGDELGVFDGCGVGGTVGLGVGF